MSSSNLIRWSGLANVVGGLLVGLGFILHPPEEAASVSTGLWTIAHALLLASLLFGILGLFGLYASQSIQTRTLGLIGFILIFIGMASFLGITYFETFINPVLVGKAPEFVESQFAGELPGALAVVLPLSGMLFSLGWLLFGIATIQANILPRWAAILAIVGGVPFGVDPVLPEIVGTIAAVVFGLGAIWLGYALWSGAAEKTTQPKPAM